MTLRDITQALHIAAEEAREGRVYVAARFVETARRGLLEMTAPRDGRPRLRLVQGKGK